MKAEETAMRSRCEIYSGRVAKEEVVATPAELSTEPDSASTRHPPPHEGHNPRDQGKNKHINRTNKGRPHIFASNERERQREKKKVPSNTRARFFLSSSSKIIPLHLECLAILQISIHDLEHRVRKSHTEQRERNLGVSVDLTQSEK